MDCKVNIIYIQFNIYFLAINCNLIDLIIKLFFRENP